MDQLWKPHRYPHLGFGGKLVFEGCRRVQLAEAEPGSAASGLAEVFAVARIEVADLALSLAGYSVRRYLDVEACRLGP